MIVFKSNLENLLVIFQRIEGKRMSDTLVVYIGAHPDDIDIGMSGSIYKFDVGIHPIMWVVVTDGGADTSEHKYDSDREWIKKDLNPKNWKAPDGSELTRRNDSEDLVQKRCGIEFNNGRWTPKSWPPHPSSYGPAFDWRTRVTNLVGEKVEKRQLSYSDQLLYPDGLLSSREEIFTTSIAENIAKEIYDCVTSNGYSKDLIYINSHAPDEVCENSSEHADHRITGNAVREAINILLNRGIKEIYATWFTIYDPISPKSGNSQVEIDISGVKNKKSTLCKACWETEFMGQPLGGYRFRTWGENGGDRRYPNSPLDFEYDIEKSYTVPTIKSGAQRETL